jgi:hypothetical protein
MKKRPRDAAFFCADISEQIDQIPVMPSVL